VEDESDGSSGRDAPAGRDERPHGSAGDTFGALRDGPTRLVPVRSETARRELREGDRRLLHCLACGRQVVARRHGGTCLLCGSGAVIVETV
jgi:hypothetical protein